MIGTIKSHWYGLSIKSKQIVFFSIIILLVSLISFYSQYNSSSFMNEYNKNLNKYYNINQLLLEVTNNRTLIEKYMKDMKEEDESEYRANVQKISVLIKIIDKDNDTLEPYLQINAIKNSLESYFDQCDYSIRLRKDNIETYYEPLYNAFHIAEYIKGYIQKLQNISLKEGNWLYNNRLLAKANWVKNLTFLSIVGISILCLAFATIFSTYLTKPIRKLAAASIKMSHGDLDIKEIKVKSTDEVGILTQSFLEMSTNIRGMVDGLKEKTEIEKKLHKEEIKNVRMQQFLKEAEFMALQSQINPHFLFNTLNTIARTAMFENAANTTKLIQSLSNLFRYNIGRSDSKVSLSKEIEITKEYLFIQQTRFRDRFKFDIQCFIETEEVMLPRFILQPLVENAFIHGLEPKEQGGSLKIKVRRRHEYISLKIIDNGIGILPEKLKNIMDNSDNYKGHTTGIGINNVFERLKIFYNKEDCLKLQSKPNFGTVITLTLPIQKETMEYV